MNNKMYYPAVFHKEDDGYSVWISDIEGCVSGGDTLSEAVENIKQALGLYYEESRINSFNFPQASSPEDIKHEDGEFIMMVEFDTIEYLKKHSSKAVKKTLSIPAWLNTAAEQNNVNFSAVLQEALVKQLHIS